MSYESSISGLTPRSVALKQGQEAVAIMEAGHYHAPSGARVDVASAIARAVERTREYASDALPGRVAAPPATNTRFFVENCTSLYAARKLVAREGGEVLILNFASAKNPGGGFLGGARAQEESLARSSALYACITGREMYVHNRQLKDVLYSHWMIYSPGVPIFRDDETGALLEAPYQCAFLTAAAPNAGVYLERNPENDLTVQRVLRERVERVLAVARAEGHRRLVLGAWGCGVFRNDPRRVAAYFAENLRGGAFKDAFDEVVFAVLDFSPERHFIAPFEEAFGRGGT